MTRRTVILASTLVFTLGCGEEEESTDEHDVVAMQIQEGCKHFEHGPHVSDLVAAMGEEAPSVERHHHYTVAVPDDGGELVFHPSEGGTFIILLGHAAATLAVTGHDGGEIAPASSRAPGDDCAEAMSAQVYELHPAMHRLALSGASTLERGVHGPLEAAHGHDGADHGG